MSGERKTCACGRVPISTKGICATCEDESRNCETCYGTGIHQSPGYYSGEAECPQCEGSGLRSD